MMIMNIFRKYGVYIMMLFTIGITSCTDELDEVIFSQLTTDNAFETKDDALAAVNGVYTTLHGLSYRQIFFTNDLPTDVCYRENMPIEILKGADMNVDQDVNSSWSASYRIVTRCNVAIDNIELMDETIFADAPEESKALKARYIAEVKFLRGWAYMGLTDLFYKIPFNTDSKIDPKTELPLTDIEIVEEQIIKDLEYAVENLPLNYSVREDAGRPSKGAALGILAKVNMRIAGRKRLSGQDATGDWNTALGYLNKIIADQQYALQPSVLDVYGLDDSNVESQGLAYGLDTDPDKLYNNEIIWAIRSNGDGPQGSTATGLVFTPWGFDMGWNLLNLPLELAWSYHPEDTRFTKLVAREYPNVYNSPGASLNNYYVIPPTIDDVGKMYQEIKDEDGNVSRYNELSECYTLKYKFQNTGRYNYNTGNNVIILRFADVLLLKAEVLNELGGSDEAIGLVNLVRERAFGNSLHNLDAGTLSDVMAVRQAICSERAWELHNEGVRRPDLIRMGLWKERMGNYFDAIKLKYQKKEANAEAIADVQNPENAPHDFDYSSKWLVYPSPSELEEDDIRRYFPIPKVETDLNQGLLNNRPGE